jgi:hypothetical protein
MTWRSGGVRGEELWVEKWDLYVCGVEIWVLWALVLAGWRYYGPGSIRAVYKREGDVQI